MPPLTARMSSGTWCRLVGLTRSCCLLCTSGGTGGSVWVQESKSLFLSLGHTPGHSEAMGISLANVVNSPPGRRAWVCWLPVAETGRPGGILGTAASEGTKVNVNLWWRPGPPQGFYQEEGKRVWATARRWYAPSWVARGWDQLSFLSALASTITSPCLLQVTSC